MRSFKVKCKKLNISEVCLSFSNGPPIQKSTLLERLTEENGFLLF